MKMIQALAAAVALLVAGTASAAERLLIPPYPAEVAWTLVTDERLGAMTLQEFIPADQSRDGYRDILSVQSLPDSRTLAPAPFLKIVISGVVYGCEHVSSTGPVEAREGDYNVAYGQIYCGRQIGQSDGVHILFKVIQGREAMYVVQRQFRVPPSDVAGQLRFGKNEQEKAAALLKAEAEANAYLTGAVRVCAEDSAEAECATAP